MTDGGLWIWCWCSHCDALWQPGDGTSIVAKTARVTGLPWPLHSTTPHDVLSHQPSLCLAFQWPHSSTKHMRCVISLGSAGPWSCRTWTVDSAPVSDIGIVAQRAFLLSRGLLPGWTMVSKTDDNSCSKYYDHAPTITFDLRLFWPPVILMQLTWPWLLDQNVWEINQTAT